MTDIAELLNRTNTLQDVEDNIQNFLQNHRPNELIEFMINTIDVIRDNDGSFDIENYFRCCWQDGWYLSCMALSTIVMDTPYILQLPAIDRDLFLYDYRVWLDANGIQPYMSPNSNTSSQ